MISASKIIEEIQSCIFHGDNLDALEAISTASVDLIYLDPPFFTGSDFNKSNGMNRNKNQKITLDDYGFKDTRGYFEGLSNSGLKGIQAYLYWLKLRLTEMHRVLTPDGSLFCHLDYHAVHYVKIILDEIFGSNSFRNEIVWVRKTGSNSTAKSPRNFSNNCDYILFYSKSKNYTFNQLYKPYSTEYIEKNYRYIDSNGERYTSANMVAPSYSPTLVYSYKGYQPHKNGWSVTKKRMIELDKEGRLLFPKTKSGRIRRKNYLKDRKGVPIGNVWDDISCLQGSSKEAENWPTQKPVALLERIISFASNKGDLVLDPFAGSGTTLEAANNLGRKWVGIEMSNQAVKICLGRMKKRDEKTKKVKANPNSSSLKRTS